MLLGTFVSTVFGGTSREEKTEAAPGRDDRRLIVERGGFLDPVWCVYVHEGSRPLERRWIVGCFNGDSERNELRETVWTAPDRIRMTTSGGAVHEVTLAPGGPTGPSPSGDGRRGDPRPGRPGGARSGQEDEASFEKPRRVRSGTRSSVATAAAPSVTVS
ncbi:hypothetical protein [Streptomyces virginiae]|uniref:hypothetical protein n=1 Tax=Streptomyces virginiae TaxID=1961 RepID=UPI00224E2674|nr:hypothetical protein [Streptomyces virginiae]MCX5180381.1 hypothetical protein [Streptomyces virginiae]